VSENANLFAIFAHFPPLNGGGSGEGLHFFLLNPLAFYKLFVSLPLHCVLRDTLQDIVGILNIRIQFWWFYVQKCPTNMTLNQKKVSTPTIGVPLPFISV